METIRRQVNIARRRLTLQRLGRTFCVTLFVMLIIALSAALLQKYVIYHFWDSPDLTMAWTVGWLLFATAGALLLATVHTFLHRPSLAEAALEIDQRFQLRERLSSSLLLDDQTQQSVMGRALIEDAERRARQLDIPEQFVLRPAKRGLLPLFPLTFFVLLIFLPDATRENIVDASAKTALEQEVQQVKTAAQQLKKRLEQQRRQAEAQGLKEAEDLFKKLERQTDELGKREDISKKDALIALNDIKEQLQQKKQQLGSPDEMRKSLANLNEMEKGPAEQAVKAMEKGDFAAAQEHVKDLAKKLQDGSLTEQEKKELAEQIKQLQKQMQDAAQKHEQQKQELKEKIEQAKREGRAADAAKLQEQLNQKEQQDGQMQQMQQMAEAMQAAQQAMEKGNMQEASEAMQQLADELGEMQASLEQLEDLQSALDQLDQAKNQMGCKECNGNGCTKCNGQGDQQGNMQGSGLGQGTGEGERPEEATDTNSYDSQVRSQPKPGRAVMAGKAGGENKKGVTRESVRDAIMEAVSDDADPLENQVLPRSEREHAQQYFDRLREGKK